ncbi:SAICAR synthase-like protein [Wolfiporia cocos MD-104 SS10]|uniref:Kinase n=1 Tax=Wolfiporia cocos (strain MD-104) TaxID=742152 RepID=A0A2H3J8I1_WOLCO|nr:SAICAR synthase-like protein [Wolfiporia cocos MD-104 SS10]
MSSQPGPSHVPLAAQVGGHPGVMTTQDGFLLVKPSLPKETAFYTSISQEPHLLILQDYVPKFYGTLRLEGKVASEEVALNEPDAIRPVEGHIVLENLTYTFLKPNILDVKLGTVLYDEDATPEKRARMEKTARETTTSETGIRLTGFQVYDLVADKPIVTPKGYGKSIKAAELPEGIARFFPLASSATPAESTSDSIGTGLPKDILLPLLSDLRLEIQELHDVLARLDVRMVGASLLILYEADWDQDEDEEEEDEEDGKKPIGPPSIVKLIDFAHSKLALGEGPDEGVLLGLRTFIGLLDGRIEQVKAA